MKFEFDDQPIDSIIEKITTLLSGRKLGEMVKVSQNGETLDVVINKMGKSVLSFDSSCENGKRCFELKKEKIAMTHKAFKKDVTDKIKAVIVKSGGKIND